MLKFIFSVKTRDGQKIESIQIQARDQVDAERKLRQMYHHCEVTQCKTINPEDTYCQTVDIDDVLSLIVKHS